MKTSWNKGKKMPFRPCPEEGRIRRSKTMTGRVYSEERRAAMRGPRKPLSDEHKEKISQSMRKYIDGITPEQLERRTTQLLYNITTEEVNAELSAKTVAALNSVFEI